MHESIWAIPCGRENDKLLAREWGRGTARQVYEDFVWSAWASFSPRGIVIRGAHPRIPFDGIQQEEPCTSP